MGGNGGSGCWFVFGGIELPLKSSWGEKAVSDKLVDIETILEINIYFKDHDNCGYEDIQIVYKNKENQTYNYLLNSAPDDEEVHRLDIYQNKDSKFEKQICSDDVYPKELYSTKQYKEMLAFALKAHKEQKTPEGLPYSFHIVSVANEIINSLTMHRISYDEANVAIACALLHDVNEDTQEVVTKYTLPYNTTDVETIQKGVQALTKDETLPSKQQQMKDSLDRLKQMPKCVQMVKLADRITNLAPAPLFWNKAKRQAYVVTPEKPNKSFI
jgi:guanosine-3',5'-bis(diphosphate) 3'-pyrophosphohydrolase